MGAGGTQGGLSMMMGGDMGRMMAMMQMMHGQPMGMGAGMGFAHIEGQIAFFKAELGITEAQTPQWNAFADVLRARAEKSKQAAPPAMGEATAPEQIERRIAMLTARSEAMQAVLGGLKPLYAVLTDSQKKTADALMTEHFMAMRRGGQ